MSEIRQLSPSVVNKIAAGEVIERPASVVKELVENSVDAGAKRIDVMIEKGGADLIRITDDGCGIDPDQLGLAVASHATSKIRDADDLFSVKTMGFRGEALASIAEVSQFVIRSRTSNASAGAELEINGGILSEVTPCACPVGTTVEIRNLFFNTPVRRKFLRTTQTEMGHITEAFTRNALAHDDLHFTLRHNNRVVHELPAGTWKDRITKLFGGEIGDALMWVESDPGPVRIYGYVCDPTQNRGNNRMQYLFLNRRHIRDRSLGHALGEGYRGLLLTGRYPIVYLRLEMAADAVDVNVHPTKLEVRFRDGGEVYSRLLSTLRSRFLTSDLTARASTTVEDVALPAGAVPDSVSTAHRRSPFSPGGEPGPAPPRQNRMPLDFSGPVPSPTENRVPGGSAGLLDPAEQTSVFRPHDVVTSGHTPASRGVSAEGTPALQVCNRYLITESEHGVVVIDQHALHERIIYEELREKVMAEAVEVQRLLVPEPVNLTPAEAAAVLESQETLSQLGIEIEPFGGDTVLVSAYPAMLANMNPSELLRGVVEQLMAPEPSPDRRDVLDSLLHMISCKAAIKAGDRLTNDEVTALIQRRHAVQDSHHCPHGRPTTLIFSREELDRMFKRT